MKLVDFKAYNKKKDTIFYKNMMSCLAEDMGLEPTGPFSRTRFPGELLSHSVNPPYAL